MAILSKGTDFSTGDQVTAAKLDALVDNATFASDAVDDSTTALDGNGKIIVKDGGVVPSKLSTGGPAWTTGGQVKLINSKSDISDFWGSGDNGAAVFTPYGFLGSNGSFGLTLVSNGYRNASGGFTSLGVNSESNTSILELLPTGVTVFKNGSPSGTSAPESMRIDADGKVGIGTTSPEAALHVKDIGTTQPCILVEGASQTEGDIAVIDGESLQIGHWSGSSFTERMSITSSGQVLIGTTTVDGTGGASFRPNFDDGAARLTFNRANTTNNSVVLQFDNNGSGVGQIVHNNSSTTYSTSSDYRLKEDILEIQDSVSRVQALKPVNFAWKIDGRRADGFLAHEAQEVVPEAVIGDKDAVDEDGQPNYQGIDQSKLVPLLTKALQEALTKIESLEARVTALES